MNKTLIIILAAALALGGGGAGWYFLMGPGATVEAAATAAPEPPGLLEMNEFLANLNDPSGNHYAKLKLTLAISPASGVDVVKGDALAMARVRDRVLTLLTSKKFGELTDPEGKEKFRGELQNGVSELLTGATLEEVLFSDFVVQ